MKDWEKRSGGVEGTGTIVCREPWYVELSPGALTPDDMARACGLKLLFTLEVCSICELLRGSGDCYVELEHGGHGRAVRTVCETCLSGHFHTHMAEQTAVDSIVEAVPHEHREAEERLLTSSPTGRAAR